MSSIPGGVAFVKRGVSIDGAYKITDYTSPHLSFKSRELLIPPYFLLLTLLLLLPQLYNSPPSLSPFSSCLSRFSFFFLSAYSLQGRYVVFEKHLLPWVGRKKAKENIKKYFAPKEAAEGKV